jgi:hypothetical protein
MRSSADRGFSILIIPLVVAVLFLIGAAAFGAWAYSKMQDYKNNVNSKVSAAVTIAKQQESTAKDAEFVQKEKLPLRTYTGPSAYGSVTIKYPKTWSVYVADDRNSSPFVDGYFFPSVVPDTQSPNSAFAVRIQVVQESYSSVLSTLADYVKQNKTQVTPYKSPNVPGVVGARVDGQLSGLKNGSMIVLPLRNMTLELWTEAPQFQDDFNKNILPNFTFSP